MRRGEIWFVRLDPVEGSEIGKTRPAVVLQNDLANESSPNVTVAPISSATAKIFPFQVPLPADRTGLEVPSKVLCEQIRTVSKRRLVRCVGQVDEAALLEIRRALDRHLWL